MDEKKQNVALPDEVVMAKIYVIMDRKVMLDVDLADLYEVENKQLKEPSEEISIVFLMIYVQII